MTTKIRGTVCAVLAPLSLIGLLFLADAKLASQTCCLCSEGHAEIKLGEWQYVHWECLQQWEEATRAVEAGESHPPQGAED